SRALHKFPDHPTRCQKNFCVSRNPPILGLANRHRLPIGVLLQTSSFFLKVQPPSFGRWGGPHGRASARGYCLPVPSGRRLPVHTLEYAGCKARTSRPFGRLSPPEDRSPIPGV